MFQAGALAWAKERIWWRRGIVRKVAGKRLVYGAGLAEL